MEEIPQQSVEPMSRRERRELRRVEQRGQQQRSGLKRGLRRVMIWGLGLALLVGLGWVMVKFSDSVPTPTGDGSLAVAVSATDNTVGPADAPITLVEYSDFQCPACGAFYPLVKQVLEEPELAGKVRFVYRNFPLSSLHPNAQLAAQAAQAAGVQGKFWEMHDMLFENQAKWSGMSSAGARGEFLKYAVALSINSEQFADDIDSGDVKKKVADDYQGGVASGVSSTPSFYVNGTKLPHPTSYEMFKAAIAAPLNATPVPSLSPSPDATP